MIKKEYLKMEDLKLPEFLSSQEKYNKLICETNTLEKFEDIYMKLLDDGELEMSSILALMKIIERDVILVNELTEATALMEMTETFIRYSIMRESETKKKKKEVKHPKTLKKLGKDRMNSKKFPKPDTEKPNDKTIPEQGVWECDC